MPTRRPIPVERFAGLAPEVAKQSRLAAVACGLLVIAIVVVGLVRREDLVSVLLGAAVFAVAVFIYLRKAQRLSAAAALATTASGHQFFLHGKWLVVTDAAGTDVPNLSVQFARRHRAHLVSPGPTARVVPPSSPA